MFEEAAFVDHATALAFPGARIVFAHVLVAKHFLAVVVNANSRAEALGAGAAWMPYHRAVNVRAAC
jgi:hypothetical protein